MPVAELLSLALPARTYFGHVYRRPRQLQKRRNGTLQRFHVDIAAAACWPNAAPPIACTEGLGAEIWY